MFLFLNVGRILYDLFMADALFIAKLSSMMCISLKNNFGPTNSAKIDIPPITMNECNIDKSGLDQESSELL